MVQTERDYVKSLEYIIEVILSIIYHYVFPVSVTHCFLSLLCLVLLLYSIKTGQNMTKQNIFQNTLSTHKCFSCLVTSM
jgi:hypothetical protein